MKDTVISGLPVYDNVEEEGVEMPFVQPDTSSTQHEEQLKEPDHQIPVRFEIHISILDMWKCQNLNYSSQLSCDLYWKLKILQ